MAVTTRLTFGEQIIADCNSPYRTLPMRGGTQFLMMIQKGDKEEWVVPSFATTFECLRENSVQSLDACWIMCSDKNYAFVKNYACGSAVNTENLEKTDALRKIAFAHIRTPSNLVRALVGHGYLTSLTLRSTGLAEPELSGALCSSLAGNQTLRSLNIGGNALSSDQLIAVIGVIEPTQIRETNLSGNSFDGRSIEVLMGALRCNGALKDVTFCAQRSRCAAVGDLCAQHS